jgi:membrane protein YdbS with pleckstrin-like domain
MSGIDDRDDPDAEGRREAVDTILRRALLWILPLTVLAALLVALGIPWWISVAAVVAALAIVVLEIDL